MADQYGRWGPAADLQRIAATGNPDLLRLSKAFQLPIQGLAH